MAQSNAQQVYLAVVEAIQQRIADGQWQPGQRLPSIPRLAHEFGVSTGSVREAARVLASRGLLRIEHGRGVFVAATPDVPIDLFEHFQRVDVGSVLEVFEARRLIEPELAALAAERGSDTELQAIHDLAVAMEHSAAAGEDFVVPDIQFHQQIAAAARNAVLAGMMAGLNELIVKGRELTVQLPGMTPRAVRYHLLIAEAILARKPLQARLLMFAHVNDAIESLLLVHADGRDSPVSSMAAPSTLVLDQRTVQAS